MTSGGPRDELQFLSIFHWAMAFLTVMAALAPLTWLVVDREMRPADPELIRTAGAAATDTTLLVAAGALLAIGIAIAAVVGRGAVHLARAERWRSCVIASSVLCLFFPLGTLLGGWTLGRLFDPQVRATFVERRQPAG